jgi:glucose-6-phosphate isomerase
MQPRILEEQHQELLEGGKNFKRLISRRKIKEKNSIYRKRIWYKYNNL